MKEGMILIEVDGEELRSVFQELNEAQEKIYECYDRLVKLGVVTIKSKTASGN